MTSRRSIKTWEERISRQTQFIPGHVGGRVDSAQPVLRRTHVGAAGAPPAIPSPVWRWDMSDEDNSLGGPSLMGPSDPESYGEPGYELGGDYTLTGPDPDKISDYTRSAADWTYSGTTATLAGGESAWIASGFGIEDGYEGFPSHFAFGPAAVGLYARFVLSGLESTATPTDLVSFIAAPGGSGSWHPTLAAYLTAATVVSTITSVDGDLLFIHDGDTLATVAAPDEPVTIDILMTETAGVTIRVNGDEVVTNDAAGWTEMTVLALTGATGDTTWDLVWLWGVELGHV